MFQQLRAGNASTTNFIVSNQVIIKYYKPGNHINLTISTPHGFPMAAASAILGKRRKTACAMRCAKMSRAEETSWTHSTLGMDNCCRCGRARNSKVSSEFRI